MFFSFYFANISKHGPKFEKQPTLMDKQEKPSKKHK